jgi:hypothetical protein
MKWDCLNSFDKKFESAFLKLDHDDIARSSWVKLVTSSFLICKNALSSNFSSKKEK